MLKAESSPERCLEGAEVPEVGELVTYNTNSKPRFSAELMSLMVSVDV